MFSWNYLKIKTFKVDFFIIASSEACMFGLKSELSQIFDSKC